MLTKKYLVSLEYMQASGSATYCTGVDEYSANLAVQRAITNLKTQKPGAYCVELLNVERGEIK